MGLTALDPDFSDALTEIANVAVGEAADKIARSFSAFVSMPIPSVHLLESADISMALGAVHQSDRVTAVSQAFVGSGMSGEALLLFTDASLGELARLMGYGPLKSDREQVEVVIEMASLLSGSCIQGVASQLAIEVLIKHPSIVAQHRELSEVLKPENLNWDRCLAVEFNCSFENYKVVCDLVILIHQKSHDHLAEKLQLLLD